MRVAEMVVAKIIFVIFVALRQPQPITGVGDELFDRISGASGRAGEEANWCYEDSNCDQESATSDWKKGDCAAGKRQSPINLLANGLKVDYEKGCPIDFGLTKENAYNLAEYNLYFRNFTIEVDPLDSAPKATFRWPAVNDGTYTLVQAHFHWGPDQTTGSEHQFDGHTYAMELHLVHFRSGGPESYKDIADAVKSGHGDALAVIGIFLKVNDTDPKSKEFLEPLINNIDKVSNPGEMVKVQGSPLMFHNQIKSHTQAFTYEGSLTTPHCNEIVQWIVLKDPVPIHSKQVEEFRRKTTKKTTFRKVQDLNDRKLKLVEIIH